MRRAAAAILLLALALALAALPLAAPGEAAAKREPLRVAVTTKSAARPSVTVRVVAPRRARVRVVVTGASGTSRFARVARARTVRGSRRALRLRLNARGRRIFAGCEPIRLRVAARAGRRTARARRTLPPRRRCLPEAGAGGPLQARGDWPQWQFDLLGSRHNPHETTLTEANVAGLKLKWAFVFSGTDGAASSQPALVDGTLYVGARNGRFYALDPKTGATKWEFDTQSVVSPRAEAAPPSPVPGAGGTPGGSSGRNLLRNGPAVVDGTVYFGDFEGYLYALDAATGKLRWATELDTHPKTIVTGSPLVYDGRVYIGVSSNEVFTSLSPTYPCCQSRGSMVALDAKTGAIDWRYYTVAEPQLVGANAYGAPRYEPSGVSIWNTPAVDPETDTLYFGTSQNYTGYTDRADAMIALDADTGRERWANQLTQHDQWTAACLFPQPGGNCPEPGPDFDFGSSPNLFRAGGRLLVGQGQKSGVYHALDARTGAIVWQTILNKASGEGGAGGQEGIQWGSSYDGRRLYVATNIAKPGTLFALDPATGAELWKAPNPADGCETGGAADARPADCEPALPAAVSSTPGVVWEGSRDGKMRAYDADDGRILWEFDTARGYEGVNGESGNGGSISHGGATIAGGMLFTNSGYQTAGSPATGIPGSVLLGFGL